MKKLLLLSLFFAAPAFGWDLNSLWKPTTETISNAWQSISPAMQKVMIAAGVVTAGGAVYAAWPIKKQVAYEKAEKHAKMQRDKIDEGTLTAKQIEQSQKENKHIATFKYGFFWQTKNKYNVSTYMSNVIGTDKSVPTIHINDWPNRQSLLYRKDNETDKWMRSNTKKFFNDIKYKLD
ncbi:MAG: hypothetical protein BWY54_00537 [Candidatus Dependentiae bacterium ADurb.Bin331]|nr:MAG: hypothetical protein BWY54_00537 [Candidatus Dependentiae bacterium ADurb.Bin331]